MDGAPHPESVLLGSLLMNGSLLEQAAGLHCDHFALDAHRKIFQRMTELYQSGEPVDIDTVSHALERCGELRSVGGFAYLADLESGCVKRSSIRHFVDMVRRDAGVRHAARAAEAISQQSQNTNPSIEALQHRLTQVAEELSAYRAGDGSIQDLADVPDVFAFKASLEDLVAGLLPRPGVCLLTGPPGAGKSFIALKVGAGCAMGGEFLGRACERTPVLYLDRENPLALVQWRLGVVAAGSVPGLYIWGGWVADEPAVIGDARLLKIAKERPLIIFDSLVRFHSADENSASEMRAVMAELRKLSDLGATVLVLHHRSKAEGSKYRGSSDILAAVDVAYSLEQTPEGLLRLHRFKSRFAAEETITIAADFATGRFDATDSPAAVEARDDVADIAELIRLQPGITQAQIIRTLKLNRTRGCELLRARTGKLWRAERGAHNSLQYFPVVPPVPAVPGTDGTKRTSCTAVPAPLGAVQGTARTPVN